MQGYTDDTVISDKSLKVVTEALLDLNTQIIAVGLEVDEQKQIIMVVERRIKDHSIIFIWKIVVSRVSSTENY